MGQELIPEVWQGLTLFLSGAPRENPDCEHIRATIGCRPEFAATGSALMISDSK